MRVLFAALISLTSIIGLASGETDVSDDPAISVKKIEKHRVTMSGSADANTEVVLRIEKNERTTQLEWTSTLDGQFDAELSSTEKLRLDGGKFGKGIVFKVQRLDNVVTTIYIALSDRDPIPNGTVRFRAKKPKTKTVPAIKFDGNAITVADVLCDDGTEIPLTVLVRERQITKP